MSIFSKYTEQRKQEIDSHIGPNIRALIERGNVTLEELNEIRCNSWEWQALVPAMTDEAFVDRMQYALNNCFTPHRRPFSTYNEAVEGLWAPELLKRFSGAQKSLRKAICALEWYEAQPRIGEIARITLAEIEGRTLVGLLDKFFDRIPAGHPGAGNINNCSLANGEKQGDCQVCSGKCPDRNRFEVKS